MPFYEYRPSTSEHCAFCKAGFDKLQKVHDEPLTTCPQCGVPVRRIISAPNLTKAGPSLEPDNLDRHGFTQYKKLDKGVYEKTAGKGPDIISDD